MSKRSLLWLGFAIFILNFLLKLIGINASSLWHDEALSVKNTFLEFGHIKHESEWDANPPLYYYCLWIWSHIFGHTEIAVRSMSAFFNALAAVCFFYFLQKRNTLKTTLVLSFVYLSHPFLFYYAQEARSYSLILLLMMVNIICTENYFIKRTYGNALLLGLLNFLLFYTHYITGIYLVIQFLFLALDFRFIWRTLLSYLITLLLVFIRFTSKQYLVIFFSSDLSKSKNNIEFSTYNSLIAVLNNLFVSKYVFLAFLILAIYHLTRAVAKSQREQIVYFQSFLLLTPVITIFIFYFLGKFTNVFAARYLIYCIPLVLAGLGALKFQSQFSILVLVGLGLFFDFQIKPGENKGMDYRLAAKLAREQASGPESAILLQTHDIAPLFTYYYDFELFKSNPQSKADALEKKGIYVFDDFSQFKLDKLSSFKRLMLLQSFVSRPERNRLTARMDSMRFRRNGTFEIDGAYYSVFSKY